MINYTNFNVENSVKKLVNIHEDRTCVIIGSGPSLNESYHFLKYAEEHNFLLLGTNQTLFDTHFNLDYHFLGDLTAFSKFKLAKHKYINSSVKKSKIWFGSCVQTISAKCRKRRNNQVLSNDNLKYLKKCEQNDERWLILDKINNRTGLISPVRPNKSLKHSTIFIVLEFALIMGFKKIYLVGCDCTGTNIYRPHEVMNYYDHTNKVSKLIEGWNLMYKFVKSYYPEVEIYSVNPVGLRDMIPEDLNIKHMYENCDSK